MIILVFILGLLIGSFLNVCIYRIPKGESIAFPPSHCGNCGKRLTPLELIPVISYILLGGRCKKCSQRISVQYPLIELVTATIFALLYYRFGYSFELVKYCIFTAFIIVISVIDLKTQDVYSITTYSGIAAGVVIIFLEKFLLGSEILTYFIGMLIGGGIIGLIVYATGGMGEGDIEIAALCGIFLGWKGILITLFFSFIIGGSFGVFLIVFRLKDRKDYIAFGPYLALGAIICIFFQQNILQYYISMF